MRDYRVKKFFEKLENLKISDHHGLSSPGLTCYLNSVLQVLFMTEDFREAVKRCSSKRSSTLDPHLSELFIQLERQVANTNNITEKLGITNVLQQRDAAEYFEKILCLTSPEASMVFKGELNHETTCHGCNNNTHSRNFFWVLPLAAENSPHKTFNVHRGLESFFEVQTVCGDNQMYCNSCNKKQNADTGCEMVQIPDVLTLLLKRFTFDYKKNCYVKLKCEADVPQTLHVQKCIYDLYTVVHHFGDLSGGHYTADIKSFETGQWYCFNDQIVKRVKPQYFEEDDFLRSCTAYLLMYKKVIGQSKKTDSSDLETCNEVAFERRRRRNDGDLNGDGKPVWRPGNILPPAVTEANGPHYGTKNRMNRHYTGGMTATMRPEWMLERHHNDKLRREARANGALYPHVKPHHARSLTPSPPKRSRSVCRATESSNGNCSVHRRKSSSLNRNEQTEQREISCKQKASQTPTKGKSEGLMEKKNGKKCDNMNERKPWKC